MAQPFAATQTISSVGVTPGIMLDPTARVTSVLINTPSTTGDITLQMTLDVAAAQSSGFTPVWSNVSSIHLAYSAGNEGVAYTFLSPVAGLRLASSTLSSGGSTMKVLQEIIG